MFSSSVLYRAIGVSSKGAMDSTVEVYSLKIENRSRGNRNVRNTTNVLWYIDTSMHFILACTR